MYIYLTRHGQTDANLEGIIQGQGDHPLNQEGINQVHKLGKRLSNIQLECINVSHLTRAIQTAEIINSYQIQPASLIIDKDLAERDYGIWEGKSFELIQSLYPEEFALWLKDPSLPIIPEAENWLDFKSRVINIFQMIQTQPYEHILVVTHGGAKQVIIANFLDLQDSRIWRIRSVNTGLTQLELTQTKQRINFFNDTSHLNYYPFAK
jgi:alpha-ribazole phosphatase